MNIVSACVSLETLKTVFGPRAAAYAHGLPVGSPWGKPETPAPFLYKRDVLGGLWVKGPRVAMEPLGFGIGWDY